MTPTNTTPTHMLAMFDDAYDNAVMRSYDTEAEDRYYLLKDLYTVTGLANANGALAEAYVYDTYGEVTVYDWLATDLDRNGTVTVLDMAAAKADLSTMDDAASDVNDDGAVTVLDEAAVKVDLYLTPVELTYSGVGNPYFFTGREVDTLEADDVEVSNDTDGFRRIQHNRSRSYDTKHGRWLQRDPLGYVDGMNLYEYVGSAPGRFLDSGGTWKRDQDWTETKAVAIAECGDTTYDLVFSITGMGQDVWAIIGVDPFEAGQEVNVLPLLRLYEDRLRSSVVKATGAFNAKFGRNDGVGDLNEAGVRMFFTAGTPTRTADCYDAYRLVFAKGLIDNLWGGMEFDFLNYTPDTIPIRERNGGISSMMVGDRGYIWNYRDYTDKHRSGAYQGENVIMVAGRRYWGFPTGAMSYENWETELRNAYNNGLPKDEQRTDAMPGFDNNEIEFLDVPQIAMDRFDWRSIVQRKVRLSLIKRNKPCQKQ